MIFGNISYTDLLIYEIEFIFASLFFFFVMQAKRELEKIEEEEMYRALRKKYWEEILKTLREKYEKGDR